MFHFALVIGIYSYCIFLLGILGVLMPATVIALTICFAIILVLWKISFIQLKPLRFKKESRLILLFLLIFTFQIIINFIGVLGPELGFDALWYHLTLPKIYLMHHSVHFIPGGLLYYSGMPQLGEMLYIAGLSYGNDTTTKLIHFSFGLLSCFALYKLQRKFFSPLIAAIGVVIFYSNLIVGWESTSSYIDLIRTFFEIMALWAFVNWWESERKKWLLLSSLMVGLAIATKLLAVGSLFIFFVLICFKFITSNRRERLRVMLKKIFFINFIFCVTSLVIASPWFLYAFFNTGNPIYPIFSKYYHLQSEPINLINFITELWIVFTQASDPISPIYLMCLPLVVYFLYKFRVLRDSGQTRMTNLIGLYSILALVVWYFTPRTGGGRFLLPYLPAFSFLVAGVIDYLLKSKKRIEITVGKYVMVVVVIISVISIGYRFVANSKYLPVIFGQETKAAFLANHLDFSFGDFYDIDGYFAKMIAPDEIVLLYGFHNLFYVNFDFIDSSWVKKGDKFNYVATQNTTLPKRFAKWKLIYENKKTMVKLYAPSKELCSKVCIY